MSVAEAPRSVSLDIAWIAEDAEEITGQTGHLDTAVETLRDLCDPRLSLPAPVVLRDRLAELATELERVSERIGDLAGGISYRIEEALGDDGEVSA